MTKEMKEILDLLKANEERGQALEPLAETAESADIEAREAELNEIAEERKALEAKKLKLEEEERAAAALNLNPQLGEKIEQKGESKMTNKEIRSSQAYVDAYANYIKTGKADECRALLTENATNGTVAVPAIVYDIVKNAWENEAIMARVRKLYARGNLKVGFEVSSDGAVIHTEGGDAVSPENLVLGIVNIVPQSIKKLVKISDEVVDMGGEEFLRYIYDEITHQIAKKAADVLIGLIIASPTTATTTSVGVPVVTSTQVSVSLVAEAMAALSDQATDPVVIMNKATWGEFKKAQYANKFNIDPFEGLDVIFNNSLKSFTVATTGDTYAIVGDLAEGAIANFPKREEIDIKYDDRTDMASDLVNILGRQYVGLGVIGPDAFVKIVK
jgi:HK97 family phage major capsid protein